MIADLAAVCTLAIWLYLVLGRGMFWRVRGRELAPAPPNGCRVAVIIPARNEAETVGATIGSLAAQDHAGALHIFLVDDQSQDATPDVARAAARQAAKPDLVTVVAGEPVPAGWTGKLWALAQGVREAEAFHPDCVLFSDADIVHAPDSIAKLAARAEAGSYALVSSMVKLQCETFAEKMLVPAFVFFFFMLYPPAWTEDARRSTAGAAGGCVLVRWAALERIGGMAAIRGELIDDCALAKAVKKSGGRLWLGLASETRSIRRYGTFAEIGRMISRTAFWQLRHSVWLLSGTVAGMFVTYMLPVVVLFTGRLVPVAFAAAACTLMTLAYAPLVRWHGRAPVWAAALPLVAVFYTGATIHSAVRYWTGRGGAWKGRIQDRRQAL